MFGFGTFGGIAEKQMSSIFNRGCRPYSRRVPERTATAGPIVTVACSSTSFFLRFGSYVEFRWNPRGPGNHVPHVLLILFILLTVQQLCYLQIEGLVCSISVLDHVLLLRPLLPAPLHLLASSFASTSMGVPSVRQPPVPCGHPYISHDHRLAQGCSTILIYNAVGAWRHMYNRTQQAAAFKRNTLKVGRQTLARAPTLEA